MASTTLGPGPGRSRVRRFAPFALARAAHLRQGLLTALGLMLAAALAGRPLREMLLVGGTVLVGQCVLGWHNDLVDARRDLEHQRPGKPVAAGDLSPDLLWFAVMVGVLLVVPLSVLNGLHAAGYYLVSLALGLGANVVLRRGLLSWLPWALAFSCYPGFLSWGGWGGQYAGQAPTWQMSAMAAAVGVAAHFVSSSWGLADDDLDGWGTLPLRLGRRIGATATLAVSVLALAATLAGLCVVATEFGL